MFFIFASIFAIMIHQCFACDCGVPDGYSPPQPSEGKLSRFPWYVVIENENKKPCGAALIDDQHIATSVHCLSGNDASPLKVYLNDNSTKAVSSVWIDERYDEKSGAYDFAVLTLTSPVDSQFKPICLREPDEYLEDGRFLISPKSGEQVESSLYAYASNLCDTPAAETHICAANFGRGDECFEGPFMAVEINTKYYLAGVSSRCGAYAKADLFTNVNLFADKMHELAPKGCWKDRMEYHY